MPRSPIARGLIAVLCLEGAVPSALADPGSSADSSGDSTGDSSGASSQGTSGPSSDGASSEPSSDSSQDSSASTEASGDISQNIADPTAGSTQQTSDGSSGSTADSTQGTQDALIITSSVAITTSVVAGVVLLTVFLVRRAAAAEATVGSSPPASRPGPALLNAGLINARGDLGALLTLALRSPSYLDQLEIEVERGAGPQLDALVRAFQMPRDRVVDGFRRARLEVPVVADQAGATRFVLRLLRATAPHLEVDRAVAADLLWRLDRERHSPEFPASAPAHRRLAGWMGVPVESVIEATKAVLEPAGSTSDAPATGAPAAAAASARARYYQDPYPLVDAIGARLETRHADRIDARIKQLTTPVARFDPAL